MEALRELESIINNLFLTTNAYFTGVYYGEEIVLAKSIEREKETVLSELLSLLVRKFINSDDLIGTPEYLFTEGNQYAIFLYNAGGNTTIVSLINSKPNFSLLRLEHDKASKSLKSLLNDIPKILEEKKKEEIKQKEEETIQEISETKIEEKIEETLSSKVEDNRINESETVDKEIEEDIKELEEIFSNDIGEIEEKQEEASEESKDEIPSTEDISKGNEIESSEIKEEISEQEEESPSLEEILLGEEALGEEVDTEIIDKIKLKFIEEIGPVGKILFKRVAQKVEIDLEKPYLHKVEEFIEKLAEEISVHDRREDFLKYCKNLL